MTLILLLPGLSGDRTTSRGHGLFPMAWVAQEMQGSYALMTISIRFAAASGRAPSFTRGRATASTLRSMAWLFWQVATRRLHRSMKPLSSTV